MWQYRLIDFDPDRDGTEEDWAAKVAADGWHMWSTAGVWTSVNGRRVRRWSLRRPCRRPFAVHDHTPDCASATT